MRHTIAVSHPENLLIVRLRIGSSPGMLVALVVGMSA